jgi:Uma2 family endonuclease
MPPAVPTPAIHYPDSDGRRMAENTLQAEWILTIFGNLDLLFRDRPDVFVAMDNLWYPVEGKPKRRTAPDVYVVFGRPKGDRGSYKQWAEGGIPLTVTFEVRSPGNRAREMARKLLFYERYGVEEYYVIDPDRHTFEAYFRDRQKLLETPAAGGLVSPRLGVRFDWQPGTDVVLTTPDGKPFLSFTELGEARERAERRAEAEADRAAAAERDRDAERARAAALAAKLRELGVDPDAV